MNDEELKKLIIIAGSRYEPSKDFIEKLFRSILRALKTFRQKSDNDFSDGDLQKTEKPPWQAKNHRIQAHRPKTHSRIYSTRKSRTLIVRLLLLCHCFITCFRSFRRKY